MPDLTPERLREIEERCEHAKTDALGGKPGVSIHHAVKSADDIPDLLAALKQAREEYENKRLQRELDAANQRVKTLEKDNETAWILNAGLQREERTLRSAKEAAERKLAGVTQRCSNLTFALEDLYATVRGECPNLLNEDSGGDASLDGKIRDLLEEGNALAQIEQPQQSTQNESLELLLKPFNGAYEQQVKDETKHVEADAEKLAEAYRLLQSILSEANRQLQGARFLSLDSASLEVFRNWLVKQIEANSARGKR